MTTTDNADDRSDQSVWWRLCTLLRSNGTNRDHLTELDWLTEIEETIAVRKQQLVAAARDQGATWTLIGNNLGMTKQAAQKRYGLRPVAPVDAAQLTIEDAAS